MYACTSIYVCAHAQVLSQRFRWRFWRKTFQFLQFLCCFGVLLLLSAATVIYCNSYFYFFVCLLFFLIHWVLIWRLGGCVQTLSLCVARPLNVANVCAPSMVVLQRLLLLCRLLVSLSQNIAGCCWCCCFHKININLFLNSRYFYYWLTLYKI